MQARSLSHDAAALVWSWPPGIAASSEAGRWPLDAIVVVVGLVVAFDDAVAVGQEEADGAADAERDDVVGRDCPDGVSGERPVGDRGDHREECRAVKRLRYS